MFINEVLKSFVVDVPRIEVYLYDTWTPSDNPQDIWHKLLLIFGKTRAKDVCVFFTQICFAKFYFHKSQTLRENEHMISEGHHKVFLLRDNTIKVVKTFSLSYVVDSYDYVLDFCKCELHYDPFTRKLEQKWLHTLHEKIEMNKSIVLDEHMVKFKND